MTTPGRYAAAEGTFAKSAGSAAARGGVLIAVAVVLGLIILAVGYDGGDDSAAIDDSSSDDDTTDTDDTTDDDTPDSLPDDDGDDDDTSVPDDDDDADDDDGTTPTSSSLPVVRPPGEVKVVVANGVGEPGLAGVVAGVLSTAGYVTEPTNTATKPQTVSQVLWIEGYENDAKAVADVIGAPASVIMQAPPDPGALVTATTVDDFHIFVIQGDDRLAG